MKPYLVTHVFSEKSNEYLFPYILKSNFNHKPNVYVCCLCGMFNDTVPLLSFQLSVRGSHHFETEVRYVVEILAI